MESDEVVVIDQSPNQQLRYGAQTPLDHEDLLLEFEQRFRCAFEFQQGLHILRHPWLAPTLNHNAADEAEGPSPTLAEVLHLTGGGEHAG